MTNRWSYILTILITLAIVWVHSSTLPAPYIRTRGPRFTLEQAALGVARFQAGMPYRPVKEAVVYTSASEHVLVEAFQACDSINCWVAEEIATLQGN